MNANSSGRVAKDAAREHSVQFAAQFFLMFLGAGVVWEYMMAKAGWGPAWVPGGRDIIVAAISAVAITVVSRRFREERGAEAPPT